MSGCLGATRALCRTNKFRIVLSDVLHIGAAVIMIITLAVSATSPKSSFSWTKVSTPQAVLGVVLDINVGLSQWQFCSKSNGRCITDSSSDMLTSLGIEDTCGLSDDCKLAGQSVIAAATFAMLFGVLSVVFLHIYTTCKDRCRFPFPRIFLLVSNFLSLCLYITVVATWYSKCHNQFNSCTFGKYGSFNDLAPGYCIATAIVCIVMSFFAWTFSFWRSCRPNADEPATTRGEGSYGHQASTSDLGVATSPSASKANYTAPASPPANGGYTNGSYGAGQTYGNDDAEGSTAGGYGGSYGGAYSNSGYAGNSAKQQSAYGY